MRKYHIDGQVFYIIHRNPVRAGLVEVPEAYAWSSYRNYVLNDETMIEVDRDWR